MCFKSLSLVLLAVSLLGMTLTAMQVCGQDSASPVAPSDRDATLKLLLAEMRSNFDKIQTWKGEYSFQDKVRMTSKMMNDMFGTERQAGASDVLRIEQGTILFALDSKENLLYTSFQLKRQEARETGGDFEDVQLPVDRQLFFQKSLISQDDYVSFEPNMQFSRFLDLPSEEGELTAVAFREATEKSKGLQESVVVDPRFFYGTNDRTFFWNDLQACIDFDMVSTSTEIRRITSEKGTHYQVDLMAPFGQDQSRMVGTYEFAEEYGYNPISFSFGAMNATPLKEISWEYRLENGIYVPSRIRSVSISGDGKLIRFERILELQNVTLNKKIDSNTFTYTGIGLKDGDRIVDRIERIGLVIRNGQPVKFADFGDISELSTTSSKPQRPLRPVMIGLGLALIALGVYLKVKEYRQRKRSS